MSEENKAMFRRYVEEVLNPGKYDRIEEFVAPEYVNYGLGVDGEPEVGTRGPEGYRQSHLRSRAAFPDLHSGIQHILGEGDWIAVNTIWSGTHRGVYLGIAPTGKGVVWGLMLFRRISNGKMVEGWVTSATHRQLQALGVDLSRYGL